MRHKGNSVNADYHPVKLYRDDLKAIYDLVCQGARGGKVLVEVGDYELDSIDEITQVNDGSPSGFRLIASSPSICFRAGKLVACH